MLMGMKRAVQSTLALVLACLLAATVPPALAEASPDAGTSDIVPEGATSSDRVLVVGDSLVRGAEPELEAELTAMGIPHLIHGEPGSSLLSSFYPYDWMQAARDLVAQFHPTIVVAEQLGNYWPPYVLDPSGNPIRAGTPEFAAAWARAAAQWADILTSEGARLYWVISPPKQDTHEQVVVDQVNTTTFDAARTGEHLMRMIRWDLDLTNGSGQFLSSILIDGLQVKIRDDDGVHLTDAGSALGARRIIDSLLDQDPAWWGQFTAPAPFVSYARAKFGLDPLPSSELQRAASDVRTGPDQAVTLVDRMYQLSIWSSVGEDIARLYVASFGRLPEPSGLRYWTERVARGTPLLSAAASMMTSREFVRLHPTSSPVAFVDSLYLSTLERRADPAGEAYWVKKLGQSRISRGELLVRFSRSSEAVRRWKGRVVTNNLLTLLIGRRASSAELRAWSSATDTQPQLLLSAVVRSEEMAPRAS